MTEFPRRFGCPGSFTPNLSQWIYAPFEGMFFLNVPTSTWNCSYNCRCKATTAIRLSYFLEHNYTDFSTCANVAVLTRGLEAKRWATLHASSMRVFTGSLMESRTSILLLTVASCADNAYGSACKLSLCALAIERFPSARHLRERHLSRFPALIVVNVLSVIPEHLWLSRWKMSMCTQHAVILPLCERELECRERNTNA